MIDNIIKEDLVYEIYDVIFIDLPAIFLSVLFIFYFSFYYFIKYNETLANRLRYVLIISLVSQFLLVLSFILWAIILDYVKSIIIVYALIVIVFFSALNSIVLTVFMYYSAVKIIHKRIKNRIKINVEG